MRYIPVIKVLLVMGAFNVLFMPSTGMARGSGFDGATIAKCRDANGKWHYGDFAAEACEQSKVTHIDEQGVHIKDSVVAPTQAEINARRAAEERRTAERKRMRDQQLRDRRLLTKYDSLEAIERARDARLQALESEIKTSETFLGRLQDRQVKLQQYAGSSSKYRNEMKVLDEQISAYEKSIASRTDERTRIIERYDEDLARYKDIITRLRESGQLVESD